MKNVKNRAPLAHIKVAKRLYILLFTFLIFNSVLYADSSQVQATARILVTKHTVGDTIRVLIETETPKDYTTESPSEKIDFSPFELKNIEVSPVTRGKNRVRRTFVLNVAAFEKGSLTFPSIKVPWRGPSGKVGEVQTDPISVEIVSVGRRPSDKDDIRPIKGPASFGKRWLWTAIASILIVVLTLILVVRMVLRRLRRPVEGESLKPPHVRVHLELKRLKEKELLESGHAGEYASGLADVLRRYVERRFGVDAMEKTTSELWESMRSQGLDRLLSDKTRTMLGQADLVKFAHAEPTRAELNTAEHALLEIVEETTPKEIEKSAKSK